MTRLFLFWVFIILYFFRVKSLHENAQMPVNLLEKAQLGDSDFVKVPLK